MINEYEGFRSYHRGTCPRDRPPHLVGGPAIRVYSRLLIGYYQNILNPGDSKRSCLWRRSDTGTPTGKLMLTMLGAIATFEREMMLERQADGIARARQEGKTKESVASQLGIGVASVYRIAKEHKASA